MEVIDDYGESAIPAEVHRAWKKLRLMERADRAFWMTKVLPKFEEFFGKEGSSGED